MAKMRGRLHIRLAVAEAELIRAAAASRDESVSELVRDAAVRAAVAILRGGLGESRDEAA